MINKPVVFISSTSDLRAARDLVGKVLFQMGYEPVWQEIEPTDGGELLSVLRQRIAPCAMMIQLVGQRYGAEPPTPTPEFGRVSYTQFEALHSETLGRKVIYHFIDPAFPVEAHPAESDDRQRLQADYRQRITAKNTLRYSGIGNPDQLELAIRRISNDLATAREESDARYREILRRDDERSASLARIEKFMLGQPQSNPSMPPALSTEDQAILDEARQSTDLRTRLNASVLQPDAETDALLARLRQKHEANEYELSMLEGKRWYYARPIPHFDKAIPSFERAMQLRPDLFDARYYAAIAHNYARLGEIAAHKLRAIEICEATLKLFPPNSPDWATTQNQLGIAWGELPTGDRAKNRQAAIDSFTLALNVHTKTDFPVEWAKTQHNLGTAWLVLPTGDLAKNVQSAIDCYTRALEVYTKADFPSAWAMAQSNLGNAWDDLPTGDRGKNLQVAIDCYTRALEVRTRADFPEGWATTQNNLASAWFHLVTGDRTKSLQTAIDCYTRALEVRTKAAFPAKWATTQNNLAAALAVLADQPNLPAGQDRCELLRRAIACSKGALTVRTLDAFPHDHANTLENMNNDRRAYEAAGCAEKVPFADIPPAE